MTEEIDDLAAKFIASLVARFDKVDKLKLAREMSEALELTSSKSAVEKATEALRRQLTPEERLTLEVLGLLAADRDYFSIIHPPDDIASPKSGR